MVRKPTTKKPKQTREANAEETADTPPMRVSGSASGAAKATKRKPLEASPISGEYIHESLSMRVGGSAFGASPRAIEPLMQKTVSPKPADSAKPKRRRKKTTSDN